MNASLNAIVPMACVTAAGIAAMVAEAFRDPGERMPIAGLGVVGLLGAAIATVPAVEPQRLELRRRRPPTTSACSSPGSLIVVGLLSLAISGPTIERERLPGGEYYALMLFATAGMMLMATATDLLVIFLALEVMSLAVYVLTGIRRDSPRVDRSGVQVLPARRLLERVLPLRHRVHLRPDRQHAARSDRQPDGGAGDGADADAAARARPACIVGFAFKVAAVPFHMWTPDAYEGAPPAVTALHVDRREGGGVRGVRARLPVGVRAAARQLGRGDLGDRRGDDDRRHRGRRARSRTSSGCSPTRASRHGGYLLVALVVGQRRTARARCCSTC